MVRIVIVLCEKRRPNCDRPVRVLWKYPVAGEETLRCDRHPPAPKGSWVVVNAASLLNLEEELGRPELWAGAR